jgi:hypothetical protein
VSESSCLAVEPLVLVVACGAKGEGGRPWHPPSAASHNPESARGSQLPSEGAPMGTWPAPLSTGNMLSRLAGIGALILVVVAEFLYWAS